MADAESEQLLALLDSNAVRAEQKCSLLRKKIVFFFQKNGASSPEDLAQEVFARATSRILQGQVVYSARPESYFYGIARNVLREDWKRAKARPIPLPDDLEDCIGSSKEVEQLERRILLEDCLQHLEAEERLFLRAYIQEGPERTARAAGITANAASIRFHRLTVKLQMLNREFRQSR